MRISEVIQRKGTQVVTIAPGASIRDLLDCLAEHNIGAVVVSEDAGSSVAGIVSERDVVRALKEQGAALLDAAVSSIMTTELVTCQPDEELESLARSMTDHRVRHLPVVVGGRLEAIVSIGDVVKARLGQLEQERDQLITYVQG